MSNYITSTAEFSKCKKYRYNLVRQWDDTKGFVNFVGLNPSTADATKDDKTIETCVAFAKRWGYGGIIMTNAFAFRATNPEELSKNENIVGDENDTHLKAAQEKAEITVLAWGDNILQHRERLEELKNILKPPFHCITKLKNGHPGHPLYKSGDLKPEPFDF